MKNKDLRQYRFNMKRCLTLWTYETISMIVERVSYVWSNLKWTGQDQVLPTDKTAKNLEIVLFLRISTFYELVEQIGGINSRRKRVTSYFQLLRRLGITLNLTF